MSRVLVVVHRPTHTRTRPRTLVFESSLVIWLWLWHCCHRHGRKGYQLWHCLPACLLL